MFLPYIYYTNNMRGNGTRKREGSFEGQETEDGPGGVRWNSACDALALASSPLHRLINSTIVCC